MNQIGLFLEENSEHERMKEELRKGKAIRFNIKDKEFLEWVTKQGLYVYAGRGSDFGNPFKMKNNTQAERNLVCDLFEKETLPFLDLNLQELRGKALGCFCAPLRCHADSIVKKINGE